MSGKKLRFAMFGTGNFGPFFARYINEAAELVAICDPSAEARARFVESTQLKVRGFENYQELLDTVAVDAVALTGPNHTHKAIAIKAAQAGRHVFCEKAMALTVPDCWEMVRACEAASVRLMVGQKRRLRPPWARMIQLRDLLGPVRAISTVGYFAGEFHGWWTRKAESGGVLDCSGVHELEWMRAMCGDVAAVSAITAPQIDGQYDFADSIHVSLQYRSGAIGFLGVSLSYPLKKYREVYGAEVVCLDGGMRCVSSIQHADIHWRLRGEEVDHHERFEETGNVPIGAEEALRREIREFVRWVADGTPPTLTWEQGLRCVEIIEAAHRSAEEAGKWMHLPLYPDLEPK
jgi:UDP-N-acetyl-2-amino-2-deoxyglucuronate dehydrogenase